MFPFNSPEAQEQRLNNQVKHRPFTPRGRKIYNWIGRRYGKFDFDIMAFEIEEPTPLCLATLVAIRKYEANLRHKEIEDDNRRVV